MKKVIRTIIKNNSRLRQILKSNYQRRCKNAIEKVSKMHKRLFWLQWGFSDNPEHFDHQIDLYYKWIESRNPLWLERGIFGRLAMKNGRLLELACGDGFNARNFYSLSAKEVVACDFDPLAIETAKAKNTAENITFLLSDIRNDMPGGHFENIVWDAAIEHFTENEIDKIINDIKLRLTDDGILSGYTLVEKEGGKSLHQHEYEFRSKEDLLRFFKPYFKHVKVFETIYPDRHNLYFWASDSVLPFDKDWTHSISNR